MPPSRIGRPPTPTERDLMRRLTFVLAFVFIFTAAFTKLDILYSHKFFDVTGRAEWIWDRHRLADGLPVAFFATRDFELPANRQYTKVKILGDPEYTLYVNGQEIGGRRVGESSALDVYDVSKVAKDGRNRMVVAVRSVNGVGGLIAAIDIAPETENYVITGRDWSIVRLWRPELLDHDPVAGRQSPMLLGEPPARRWNYLSRTPGLPAVPAQHVVQPTTSFSFDTALPEVKAIDGVAVSILTPTHATAYDFGPTHGRARVSIKFENGMSRLVKIRYANNRNELQLTEGEIIPLVLAAGERSIVDTNEHLFRYVIVYGVENAQVEILQR